MLIFCKLFAFQAETAGMAEKLIGNEYSIWFDVSIIGKTK